MEGEEKDGNVIDDADKGEVIMEHPRRAVLLASVAVLAFACWPLSAAIVPIGIDKLYIPNPDNPKVSFANARESIEALVQLEMKRSAEDFNTKYARPDRIKQRVWDKVQLTLIQHYQPIEQPYIDQ